MTAYQYKALSQSGAKVSGVVEAYDEYEAVAKIKTEYGVVLEVKAVPERRKERIDLNEPLWISNKVLSITASQFAILLKAGLPIVRTVEVISQQSTDKLMRRVLSQVAKDVAAGYSLAQSLETRGKKIPVAFIETVRAGEGSATLAQSFEKLAAYYDKAHKTRSKVRGAMMYPLFLLILAVVVIAIVVTVTVPVMSGIITQGGGTLPLPTRMLLGITGFVSKWWWLMVALLCLGVILFYFYAKSEKGRTQLSKLSLRLPILGKIAQMNAASQFANTMATLLSAGLPIPPALGVTGKVIENYVVGLSVGKTVWDVESGKRLGQAIGKNPYLPALLMEMTAVGEDSGTLEETLSTIGAYYDAEAEQAAQRALAILEPAITMILGLTIGFIVIALYLPMFTMYTAM